LLFFPIYNDAHSVLKTGNISETAAVWAEDEGIGHNTIVFFPFFAVPGNKPLAFFFRDEGEVVAVGAEDEAALSKPVIA